MSNEVINWGAYIPTTTILDVSRLYETDIKSPEFKELIVRLYQTVNNIANVTNIKDTGYYLTTTFQTGQNFFNVNNDFNNLRPIYRVVVNFGALPNNTTKAVAHGITNLGTTWSDVKLYAVATKPNNTAVPVPGFDPTDITKPMNLWMDGTNVNIQTTSNMSAYTITWVVVENILN